MNSDKSGKKTGRKMTQTIFTGGTTILRRQRTDILPNGASGKSQRKGTMSQVKSGVKFTTSNMTIGNAKHLNTTTISRIVQIL